MNNSAKNNSHQHHRLRTYLAHHRHAWRHGLRQLTKNPFASILTIAVISITLVLPTGLLVVLSNLQTVTGDWNTGTSISAYMNMNATQAQIDTAQQAMKNVTNIATVQYISPQEGLAEFAKQTGLTDVLQTLGQNPLPGVFKVTPINQTPPALNMLASQLGGIANIAAVKVDMEWVMRLNAIIDLLKSFTYGLAVILAIAVLLIVGNTIRMNIQNYHQEIEVLKLVGASKRFIRRPFLYSGVLYGLCAAIFTAVILDFFLLWLQGPLNSLTSLYSAQFSVQGLTLWQTLELIIVGVILGYLGTWLVVDKYLKKIQPE